MSNNTVIPDLHKKINEWELSARLLRSSVRTLGSSMDRNVRNDYLLRAQMLEDHASDLAEILKDSTVKGKERAANEIALALANGETLPRHHMSNMELILRNLNKIVITADACMQQIRREL